MEETLSLIIHGCELARHLEANLPHLSNQPNYLYVLSNFCGEISRVFKSASDRLNANNAPSFPLNPHTVFHESLEPRANELDVAVQAWLRSSYTQAVEHVHAQISNGNKNPFSKMGDSGVEMGGMQMGNVLEGAESSEHPKTAAELQMPEGVRIWKDGNDKRTVRVATPRLGNPDIPPDDGFTWRKYGQKEILGSLFPRGYYRCTHKSFYGCHAKKQVQRLDEEPNTFEVTYYGLHTCHISPTVTSAAPSSSSIIGQPEQLPPPPPPQPPSTSIPLIRWLSMDRCGIQNDKSTLMELDFKMCKEFNQRGESGNISTTAGEVGTSQVRDAKEGVDCPVVDLADAMFNSGGSSSNSMDSIFPSSMDDKLTN
ncbi:hypothetical protein IFM89_031967 [Coptis chinensis]|uniref:WRKY domain-containing protein n=1 Tax=Coptis chinensis TaxID=261450 RepID=A0A835HID0_9MAGN|nr:hypothetical protein IFM89_031967 [Coptis chinensis]